MRIVVLAGGVGGSRFVRGVQAAWPTASIDVVVNTADDVTMHGLRICPDLDTLTYALGGAIDPGRGWGLADEGWRILDEFRAHDCEPTWFALGDRDIATHLVRTEMLAAGVGLAEVTRRLTRRWLPADSPVTLWPMTEDPVESHVVIDDPQRPGQQVSVHFQEYWVRHHAAPVAHAVRQVGIDSARPTPGLADVVAAADLVLVAPSNPVVSIGPILAVPGLRELLTAGDAPVVGFAGILAGAPVLGMADKLLPAIGVPVDAAAVGLHYGARSAGGLLDGWLMDTADAASVPRVTAAGIACGVADLLMPDAATTAGFVRRGVRLVSP